MKRSWIPVVGGLVTVLILSLMLGLFGLSGWIVSIACTGVGILAYTALQNKASSRSLSPATVEQRTAALVAPPSPGRAKLIIHRSNSFLTEGFMGRTLGIDLAIDGTPITQLTNPRFTALEITPGPHILSAGSGTKRTDTPIQAAPGETLIFQLTLPKGSIGDVFALTRQIDTIAVLSALANIPFVAPDLDSSPL